MASLTSCMKKAGTALRDEDRAAILARFNELTGGNTKAAAAARQAVDEQIAAVRALLGGQDATSPAPDEAAAPAPAVQPSANTIFTEDAAAAARARLRAKLGRLQSGIDPETLMDGITLAGYHIEKGARTFSAYARAMVDDLGDGVKPYLQSWYMAVRADPRAADFRADMDKASAVEDLDVDQVLEGADKTDETEETSATDETDETPAPPAAPPTNDPFAGDYAALEGKMIEQTVTTDDGKTATLRMDAAVVMRDFDTREKTLEDLRLCLGRAA